MARMRNNRIKAIPLITQEKLLLKAFPRTFTKRNKNKSLIWIGQLQPTLLSSTYTVLIKLVDNKVETFVLEPKKLELYKDEKILPHVYSTTKQQLCLYFPDGTEWNRGKLLVDTIIPWASEWFYFYEIWLVTGEWLGGGTEHDFEENKKVA